MKGGDGLAGRQPGFGFPGRPQWLVQGVMDEEGNGLWESCSGPRETVGPCRVAGERQRGEHVECPEDRTIQETTGEHRSVAARLWSSRIEQWTEQSRKFPVLAERIFFRELYPKGRGKRVTSSNLHWPWFIGSVNHGEESFVSKGRNNSRSS